MEGLLIFERILDYKLLCAFVCIYYGHSNLINSLWCTIIYFEINKIMLDAAYSLWVLLPNVTLGVSHISQIPCVIDVLMTIIKLF